MGASDIIAAVKNRDWHSANQAFAQAMQQKLADRLAVERKQVFKEGALHEGPFGPCKKCGADAVSFTGTCTKCGTKAGGSFDKPEYDTPKKPPVKEAVDPANLAQMKCANPKCGHAGKYHRSDMKGGKSSCTMCACPQFKASVKEGFDHATVQRVYDENRDVIETELLCNVESLKVNRTGQVISYVAKD